MRLSWARLNPDRATAPWQELAADPADYALPEVHSDDVCALLYTSGTVSAPKGVQHSHNSLLAEQTTLPDLLAGGGDDVQLVTFPPGHIAGLNSTLRPLTSGTDGSPMSGCVVRVLDADGADQPLGVDGEVVVQGPDQFVGYHDPALNVGAFTTDGWFRAIGPRACPITV